MNWWLSLALFGTAMWYIWAENFPLWAYSNRTTQIEKVALLLALPSLALIWGMV